MYGSLCNRRTTTGWHAFISFRQTAGVETETRGSYNNRLFFLIESQCYTIRKDHFTFSRIEFDQDGPKDIRKERKLRRLRNFEHRIFALSVKASEDRNDSLRLFSRREYSSPNSSIHFLDVFFYERFGKAI